MIDHCLYGQISIAASYGFADLAVLFHGLLGPAGKLYGYPPMKGNSIAKLTENSREDFIVAVGYEESMEGLVRFHPGF